MIVERVNDGKGIGIVAGPVSVIVNGTVYGLVLELRPLFDVALWLKKGSVF